MAGHSRARPTSDRVRCRALPAPAPVPAAGRRSGRPAGLRKGRRRAPASGRPARRCRRRRGALMYRLRRLRFERIGHADARFRTLVLDLTGSEVTVTGDPTARTVDAIVWLRNGGGKSSLLALFYSLLLPAKVDFIGHAKKKSLADYLAGGDAAHVVAEWEDDTELWGGPALITGGVYQWKNGHRPRDLEASWDDLLRRWYRFRPIPGVLDLDSLPVAVDGSRLSLNAYVKALNAVMEGNHRIDLVVAKDQTQWEGALTNVGLDPRIFKVQRDMNRDEGAITELFSFDTPERFIDFLIDLVVDVKLPIEVRKNLEQQARTIAQRPARELEQRFLSTAVLRLQPVREATASLTTSARDLAQSAAAIDLARNHIVARATARDTDAEVADADAAVAHGNATEEYRRRARSARRATALTQVVNRLTIAEARTRFETADRKVTEARLAERGWEALGPAIDLDEHQRQYDELNALIAQEDQRAAPLREARHRAATALHDRLLAAKASAAVQRDDAAAQAAASEADVTQAGIDREAALVAAVTATSALVKAQEAISETEAAERQARTAGQVDAGESVAASVARYERERQDSADRRDAAAKRSETITAELHALTEQRGERALRYRDVKDQHDTTWDTLTRLGGQRHTLSRHPRLIELAAADADAGLDLDVAGTRLVGLLTERVQHAESRLVAEEVTASDDRRAQLALAQTHFLPPPLDVEQTLEAVNAAGVTAVSGLQFLRDTVTADRHAEVIRNVPQIVGGVVILGEIPDDDLPGLINKTNLTTTLVVQVSLDQAARRLVAADPGTATDQQVVVPLRSALLEREAADAEEHLLQVRLAGLDARRQRIAEQRETDRRLAADLRSHLEEFHQHRRDELHARLAQLAQEMENLDALEEAAAAEHVRLDAERTAAKATEKELNARLETLASLLPTMRDLARRVEAVAQFKTTAAEAEAEHGRQTRLAEQYRDRAEQAQRTATQQHRAATLRGADVDRYDAEARDLDIPDDSAPALDADELATLPLDLLRRRFSDAERMWHSAIGDSALHAKAGVVKAQLEKVREALSDFTEQELQQTSLLRDTPDAVEPERRRAALSQARQLREASEAERTEAKTLLKQANDAESLTSTTSPREDDPDSSELDPGPLDYPDAATARLALAEAESASNTARSAANSQEQLRDDRKRVAAAARAEADTFRSSERVLAATVASLPVVDIDSGDLADVDEILEREGGLGRADAASLTVKGLPSLEGRLQAVLNRRTEGYRKAQEELAQASRQLQGFAQRPEYAKVVDRRLVERLSDDPEILRRKIDELIDDVTLRERLVAATLEAIERDQLLLVQQCAGLIKSVFDDLDQVSQHSALPKGLGKWSGQRFLGLEMTRWGGDEELARRLSLEIDRMVAAVGPEDSQKATALPEPMMMTKRLVLAALGGSGHVVAKVLKPKPNLAVERVSVTQIQKFSGGELLTVSVMLYCILARLRAANRGKRLPGGVGTLLLDNPFSKATYVLFLKLQREVAAAHGVQLVYATAVRDLLAIGQFPLILRLRNGTDERTRTQYVQIVERFGDAVRDAVSHAQDNTITGTRLYRVPDQPTDHEPAPTGDAGTALRLSDEEPTAR
ncbi:hypothetical protein AB0M46_05455 [Dactylosporangium sp. NPDC051485]|uniref:hypothetical protein n=1 Tax=Dactylosporangium sp. NPDC051485 TaxID=3154846 RepID=UPI0034397FC2